MFTKTKVASAIATILAMNHQAHANSARLVNPANNHAYQCLDSALDWNTAKTVCSNMGAHLTTITSQVAYYRLNGSAM
jgi:hypothetical protein